MPNSSNASLNTYETTPEARSLRCIKLASSLLGLTLSVICGKAAGGAPVVPSGAFTAEERAWIIRHPVVRFAGIDNLKPLEYVENGRYSGLSSDYLEFISRVSGLTFEYVPSQDWEAGQAALMRGEVDLVPNVSIERVAPEMRSKIQFTRPYLSVTSVVFTLPEASAVLQMEELEGKRVAARRSGMYAELLKRAYPKLSIIAVDSPDDALDGVVDGRFDAAIGTSMTFQPFMRRRFVDELNISRPQIDLVMLAQMGTRADDPMLGAIIRRSMEMLSTKEESEIRERWLRESDYGRPTLATIIKYNAPQLLAIAAAILLLLLFAHRANVAKRRAAESEGVKTRFLAVMSHEIRTPINAMFGCIDMLQDSQLDAAQRHLVTLAGTAVETLDSLLDNVLDLSRLKDRGMELEQIPTDVGQLLKKAVHLLEDKARSKDIQLNLDLEGVDRPLMVDPTRVRQVVVNLLGNAIKFTSSGSVSLTASLLDAPVGSGQHLLSLSVQDTGSGIEPSALPRIFDAYRQADSSTTRKHGGTGLGLSICHELVHLMGGSINLRSTVGVGTLATVLVPVALAPTALRCGAIGREPGVQPDADRSAPVTCVLVVDDHEANRFVLAGQLKALGIAVETCRSGHEALERLRDGDFDLVLMDCHMPDMDGYATTRALRQYERQSGLRCLPVVAISAATDAAHLQQCTESGMDGVLKKPIRREDLRAILRAWIADSTHNALDATIEGTGTGDYQDTDLPRLLLESLQSDLALLRLAVSLSDLDGRRYRLHRLLGAAYMCGEAELVQWLERVQQEPADDTGLLLDIDAWLHRLEA